MSVELSVDGLRLAMSVGSFCDIPTTVLSDKNPLIWRHLGHNSADTMHVGCLRR